ncbi:MAG: OmpP1/FadL family transporter [Polyangiales bacterium]
MKRALLTVSVLLFAARASAGPAETFGYGSRSTAMGGAVSADANDVSANYYNPAGLASSEGLKLEIGYLRSSYWLKMNGKDNQVDPVRAITFGLVAPGKIKGIPFAFGVALHLPDARVFRVRSLDQEQPRWEMYDNRPQRMYLSTNLAIRPVKWLEIGGGLVYLAATKARLDLSGTIDLGDPSSSELRHEVDADLTSIRYPQAGIRIHATDKLRFAAVYRGEFQLTLDIQARLAAIARLGTIPVPLLVTIETHSVNAFLPQQAVFGGSYDVTDQVTVDADLTWVNWSAYKSPVTAVAAKTEVSPPAGFPQGLLQQTPAPTVVLPPNFQDRLVPRVGVEWRIPLSKNGHVFSMRGGYFFERSPAPAQTGDTNFVDSDRHAFSAGMGIRLHDLVDEIPGDVRFDTHVQYSFLPDRDHAKTSPTSLVGDYRAGGHIWSVGAVLGIDFK